MDAFDPYRKWLGIPKSEQPPHYYRLLGIEPFESDLDVIEAAVDRQMSFIRQYQSSANAVEAAKILNELASARVCLLKPATKQAYDEQLRSKLKPKTSPEFNAPVAEFPFAVTDKPAEFRTSPSAKKKSGKSTLPIPLLLAGSGGLIVVAILALAMFSGKTKQNQIVQQEPSSPASEVEVARTPADSEPLKTQPAEPVEWKDSRFLIETAGEPVDLMKGIDFQRDVLKGVWEPTTTALIGGQHGRLYLQASLPEDYQLKFAVRRLDGQDGFLIGFIMAGRQGMIALDGWNSAFSGLYVDGRDPRDNCTSRPGKLFADQSVAKVVLTVHPGHLHVSFDGKTIIDWHGDPERLFVAPHEGMANRETPFLSLGDSRFVVESGTMVPIKPEEAVRRPDRLNNVVDVIPMIDQDRDIQRGIWSVSKESLRSPHGWAKTYLPTVVPHEYTLSAVVELPEDHQGGYAMGIGLVAGRSNFQLVATEQGIGLDMLDRLRRWDSNETRLLDPIFKPGQRVQLNLTVTAKGIRIDADGKTLIDWRGDPQRLSMPGDWSLPDARRLSISSLHHFKFRDIKLGPPLAAPGVLAAPPASEGKPLDLLSVIELPRDILSGNWERDGKSIRAMGNSFAAKLVAPIEPPAEYKLTFQAARETGTSALFINLPTAGHLATFAIDGHGSTVSGLQLDDGQYIRPPATYQGRLLPPGQTQEFVITVRRTGIKATCGDRVLFDWTGNLYRFLSETPVLTPQNKIALVSWDSRFRIEKLELERLEPSAPSIPPPLPSDGKLLPILNGPRDSRQGDWAISGDSLISPMMLTSRFRLPAPVPARYTLSGQVERRRGNRELLLGIVVDGHECSIAIDAAGTAGIDLIDNCYTGAANNLVTRKYATPLLPLNQPVFFQCSVLSDAIVVECGETQVIRWRGDARRLSPRSTFLPPNPIEQDRKQLWLGAVHSEFVFRDLELKPLDDAGIEKIASNLGGIFPTTSQADVPFMTADGKVVASVEMKIPTASGTPNSPSSQPAVGTPAVDRLKDIRFENAFSGRISVEGKPALLAQMGGNDASEAAIDRGLKWLAKHQFSDGGWSFDHDSHPDCLGQCRQSGTMKSCRTGATGLVFLAFLGNGQTPKHGEYQSELKRGVEFLQKNSRMTPQGLDLCPTVTSNEKMYVQGICAMALCELAGLTKDNRAKSMAGDAVKFITNGQNPKSGGWRYLPYPQGTNPGDTSVVGWQIMALKAAKTAKINFPPSTFRGAELFLNSTSAEGGSRYVYESNPSSTPSPSMTAAGLLCRMYMGWDRNNKALEQGVKYLASLKPSYKNMYFNYYATQVMYHWGGDEWNAWNTDMRDLLVRTQVTTNLQHAKGSWEQSDVHGDAGGRLYMTCLSLMTLEVYYRYLPLYRQD